MSYWVNWKSDQTLFLEITFVLELISIHFSRKVNGFGLDLLNIHDQHVYICYFIEKTFDL